MEIQFVPVFSDITKITYFWWKIADVNKTQGVCHVSTYFLDLRHNCAKFHHSGICVRDFRDPWTAPKRPILNRVNIPYFRIKIFATQKDTV